MHHALHSDGVGSDERTTSYNVHLMYPLLSYPLSSHCQAWRFLEYKWYSERQRRVKLDEEIKKLVNANEKLVLIMFRCQSTVLRLTGIYIFKMHTKRITVSMEVAKQHMQLAQWMPANEAVAKDIDAINDLKHAETLFFVDHPPPDEQVQPVIPRCDTIGYIFDGLWNRIITKHPS